MNKDCQSSSFRDPSGFIFFRNGVLYRQINKKYTDNYNLFLKTGLYKELTAKKMLISHEETDISPERPEDAYITIRPRQIPFISYPYEWCFSQLKHAALLTLKIQKISLAHGLSLKDASAYNVQFLEGRPVFIDTLSFEQYDEGKPWIAYRQFCQHFLAPLLLMQYTDIRLNQLSRVFLDGIPISLASSLLPKKTWCNLGILIHIHMHARSERKYADSRETVQIGGVRKKSLLGLIDNLITTIEKMDWQPEGTEWAKYYDETNYSDEAFEHKKALVASYLDIVQSKTVWDLGANNGLFSRIASNRGIYTVSFDCDPACTEQNYRQIVQDHNKSLLPLLLDLTNPSPSLGWENNERLSLIDRGKADMVFALALMHHLAISNNVPFRKIAEFCATISNFLIIEYIPKDDSQVRKLLLNRQDIFSEYSQENFEASFGEFFIILRRESIKNSQRTMYLMKCR